MVHCVSMKFYHINQQHMAVYISETEGFVSLCSVNIFQPLKQRLDFLVEPQNYPCPIVRMILCVMRKTVVVIANAIAMRKR